MKGNLPVCEVQADYSLIFLANAELPTDSTSSDNSHHSSQNISHDGELSSAFATPICRQSGSKHFTSLHYS